MGEKEEGAAMELHKVGFFDVMGRAQVCGDKENGRMVEGKTCLSNIFCLMGQVQLNTEQDHSLEGVIGLIKFSACVTQLFKIEGGRQSLAISLSWASLSCFVEVGSTSGSASSNGLMQSLLWKFEEKQIHKVDHLPRRNLIDNLTVLRSANLVLEALWSCTYMHNIQDIFIPVIQKKFNKQGELIVY